MSTPLRQIWEISSTVIVTLAAVVMVFFYVHERNLLPEPPETQPTSFDDWREWSGSAIRMGPEDAGIVISVFSEFTCPYCRELAPSS